MTGFLVNQVGGVFTPLVAKDKGDISNRFRCAGEQWVNNAQMAVGDVVAIGGVAAVTKSAMKNGKLGKVFSQGYDKMIKGIAKLHLKKGNVGVAKKILEFVKTAPTYGKAGALALMIALPALAVIHGRHLFRQGQIDQKYTDRAKVENHSKNILDC